MRLAFFIAQVSINQLNIRVFGMSLSIFSLWPTGWHRLATCHQRSYTNVWHYKMSQHNIYVHVLHPMTSKFSILLPSEMVIPAVNNEWWENNEHLHSPRIFGWKVIYTYHMCPVLQSLFLLLLKTFVYHLYMVWYNKHNVHSLNHFIEKLTLFWHRYPTGIHLHILLLRSKTWNSNKHT